MGLNLFLPPFVLTNGPNMRSMVDPIWIRIVFNSIRSLRQRRRRIHQRRHGARSSLYFAVLGPVYIQKGFQVLHYI